MLELSPATTILNMKEILEEKHGFNVNDQRLVFGSQTLLNERTLASYNITTYELNIYLHYPGPLALPIDH